MIGLRWIAAALAVATAVPVAAQEERDCAAGVVEQTPRPIWPGIPPGMAEWGGVLDVPVTESATPDGRNIFNVTTPTWQAFLPDLACANGAAVLVVPGGGFRLVAIRHEGTEVARWLAARGIAAFVVKYRTVQYAEPSLEQPVRRQLPLAVQAEAGTADTREALRLLREQAAGLGIDPARTGAIGFSAGGHVVVSLGMDADQARRPAFVGNIYGALFVDDLPALPPANLPYPPGTPSEVWLRPPPTPAPGALPPFFMAMAQDDRAVSTGFHAMAQALAEAGYLPETHLYVRGGHGFGMNRRGLSTDLFIAEFHAWLAALGVVSPEAE